MKSSLGGRNILLHFLDRENRKVWKLYSNHGRAVHTRLLSDALRLCIFACEEFCLLTPGAVLDCDISRSVLLAHPSFLSSSLIRFPLRERSFEEFLSKREKQYGPYKENYPHLSLVACERMLRKYPECVIARKTAIGETLVDRWEASPDNALEAASVFETLYPGHIEIVRRIPSELRDRGLGVTWAAISAELSGKRSAISDVGQILLQREYFQIYLREFPFATLSRLPFDTVQVVPRSGGLAYDYHALREGLMAARLWNFVMGTPDEELVQLRSVAGYFAFRKRWETCCALLTSPREIGAFVAQQAGLVWKTLGKAHQRYIERVGFKTPEEHAKSSLSATEVSLLDEYLTALGSQMSGWNFEQRRRGLDATQEPNWLLGGHIMSDPQGDVMIAIFVALAEERDLLVARWGLHQDYPAQNWVGTVGRVSIQLFSSGAIGRVPAAVATMKYLSQAKPVLLIAAGIAGGFGASGTQLGDVIVAKTIADLATRKLHSDAAKQPREFRPEPFRPDQVIWQFLDSGSFDRPQWEADIIRSAEWPSGRRPTLRNGPIACLDEVVSSTEWQTELLAAWPKLLGVEMESGGVCYAAEQYRVPVAVVRGVSDLADPEKSDDGWRKIGLKTVASALEECFDAESFVQSLNLHRVQT